MRVFGLSCIPLDPEVFVHLRRKKLLVVYPHHLFQGWVRVYVPGSYDLPHFLDILWQYFALFSNCTHIDVFEYFIHIALFLTVRAHCLKDIQSFSASNNSLALSFTLSGSWTCLFDANGEMGLELARRHWKLAMSADRYGIGALSAGESIDGTVAFVNSPYRIHGRLMAVPAIGYIALIGESLHCL